MFTGIVKAKGTVRAIRRKGGDVRVRIDSPGLPWSSYETGESIAVNGVCLTAVELDERGFETDVSVESLDVTALGRLAEGDPVNLEPSLKAGDRLGGHFVSGHVDCTGTVASIGRDARSLRLAIEIPREFVRYVARKGSICVDGVSLTVNAVSDNRFETNIIPHTADATIIGGYAAGTLVNIEVDLLARYLERLLEGKDAGVSMEFLRKHGYA